MSEAKPFYATLPGILTGLAALIGAVTGLYVAFMTGSERETESGKTADPIAAETKSRTRFSLPGDAILHFRPAEGTGMRLVVEVDYTYNERHGANVMAAALLTGRDSGQRGPGVTYEATPVPNFGSGTVRIPTEATRPGQTNEITISLYERGKPREPFARRRFPFQRFWSRR